LIVPTPCAYNPCAETTRKAAKATDEPAFLINVVAISLYLSLTTVPEKTPRRCVGYHIEAAGGDLYIHIRIFPGHENAEPVPHGRNHMIIKNIEDLDPLD
jgi:hypothetical protein